MVSLGLSFVFGVKTGLLRQDPLFSRIIKIYNITQNFKSNFEINNINYWLDYWILMYSKAVKFIGTKRDLFFLSYETLKMSPEKQLNKIYKIIDEKFEFKNSQIFNKPEVEVLYKVDKKKLKIANDLYSFIKNYKI